MYQTIYNWGARTTSRELASHFSGSLALLPVTVTSPLVRTVQDPCHQPPITGTNLLSPNIQTPDQILLPTCGKAETTAIWNASMAMLNESGKAAISTGSPPAWQSSLTLYSYLEFLLWMPNGGLLHKLQ
jgi:hypothetical protein